MNNSAALMDKGFKLLQTGLGIVEAERFIYAVKSEEFDYTKWQHEVYDSISLRELNAAAAEDSRKHPWQYTKAKSWKPKAKKNKTVAKK